MNETLDELDRRMGEVYPAFGINLEPDALTMDQIENWSRMAFERDAKIHFLEEEIKIHKEARDAVVETIRQALNHFHKEKYISAFGNIEIRKRKSVRTPKTPEEKKAFFEWLQAKGIFWDYATVNSNSLNSLVKTEVEANPGIPIPGIGEMNEFQYVVLRKG